MSPVPIFLKDVDLKKYCTWSIGGNARYFAEIHSIEEMQQAILFCNQHKLRYMVLGKGSNCLFDDRGFNGAVLLNKINFLNITAPGCYHAGAGYSFPLLGVQTARNGWSGLEFASGIPATVGGAVYMNAGANGQETCQTLDSVDYVNENGILEKIHRSELTFSYRHSPFQKRQGAIVGASFVLKPHEEARKKQIDIVNYRKKSQPLADKSAGCVFLNPKDSHAGALIEQCGLKNCRIGDAQVSAIHANFLINSGKATCSEMLDLIALVKAKVLETTGIELISEVRLIPYDAGDV